MEEREGYNILPRFTHDGGDKGDNDNIAGSKNTYTADNTISKKPYGANVESAYSGSAGNTHGADENKQYSNSGKKAQGNNGDTAYSNDGGKRGSNTKGAPFIRSKISARFLNLYYSAHQALFNVNIDIPEKAITAFIGPSGCGKSTLLRCFNRMNDLVQGCRIEGKIMLDGEDISAVPDVNDLRRRVGMVFQRPNPFPMSIYDNIAYGPRACGVKKRSVLDGAVEKSLRQASIWDEVKDRLGKSALGLSGGQQQRLCIARSLAVQPDVLLMDEPTSALDPISTSRIEDLLDELRGTLTVVIVTHNMQQAARISDRTAFFLLGQLIECDETGVIFRTPKDKRTSDYITGRFG